MNKKNKSRKATEKNRVLKMSDLKFFENEVLDLWEDNDEIQNRITTLLGRIAKLEKRVKMDFYWFLTLYVVSMISTIIFAVMVY